MTYITVMQSPMYHQLTLEEFLFQQRRYGNSVINDNTANTRTYAVDTVSRRFLETVSVPHLISQLVKFNEHTEYLREKPRKELYYEFFIPKKSGGLRKIDAPCEELMEELRNLKRMFETDFRALYHTSAFAYVKKRSTLDAVKRHQANESKWFGKLDLSNFFGNTTLEWSMKMLGMIFPFSEVVQYGQGEQQLEKAVELGFLNGGLPQGTPLSPMLTNILMIPIDYALANAFRDFQKQQFVYTRYSDDTIVSSKYDFDIHAVERLIVDTHKQFDSPHVLNVKKTRYGSSSGSNWNLGVMLNKDNEITVGYKNKRQFRAMITSYVADKQHGVEWDLHDIQTMEGLRNYYRNVERDAIDEMVKHVGEKYNADIVGMIRADLKR